MFIIILKHINILSLVVADHRLCFIYEFNDGFSIAGRTRTLSFLRALCFLFRLLPLVHW